MGAESLPTGASSLPSKEQTTKIQAEMRRAGVASATVEMPSLLGLTPRISYTIGQSVERLANADPKNVQEVVASQVQLLSTYYQVVLDQARASFRWALVAAGVGLLFFLASLAFLLVYKLPSASTISLVSGGIVEAISGLNFYLYGRTATQLGLFHTRLDQTQRFLLANSICEGLEGSTLQEARARLAAVISGSRAPESQCSDFAREKAATNDGAA